MLVSVYDDSGAQITNIDGMQLYYNNVLSPAGMTWNGKAYEGEFDIPNFCSDVSCFDSYYLFLLFQS